MCMCQLLGRPQLLLRFRHEYQECQATDLQAGLNAAGIAARTGATATATMAPKHGRAGWIGERAQGNEDAGATVVAVVFEALTK